MSLLAAKLGLQIRIYDPLDVIGANEMNGAVEAGPTAKLGSGTAPAIAQVSATTSIAGRIMELETKQANLYDINQRIERVLSNLISQNQELRDQLGLTPLAPDVFS